MLAAACTANSGGADDDNAVNGSDDSSKDDITQVNQSKVKRQSIGNCWLYATVSWAEALNKAATNQEANISESWLTYWHWFDQIANGEVNDAISTGGTYGVAANLMARYGVVNEADFIGTEANAEMSGRQKQALDAINLSLKSGVLKDGTARADRKKVRAELDRAWGLDATMKGRIDAVFGNTVARTLDRSSTAANAATANKVILPKDFKARLKDPQSGEFITGSLADAIGTGSSWSRSGRLAFNEVNYPWNASERRAFWVRVQKALHDEIPVITSWKVDFNALTRDSRFSKDTLDQLGPGNQGGHMTVMHDYQAEVPGIGLLKAGEQATKEQMTAALAEGTKIQFVRVKNSWGGIRPDRWDNAVLPGYHDLEMGYIDGPIKECGQDAAGNTDRNNCTREVTPLWDVVLPPGY